MKYYKRLVFCAEGLQTFSVSIRFQRNFAALLQSPHSLFRLYFFFCNIILYLMHFMFFLPFTSHISFYRKTGAQDNVKVQFTRVWNVKVQNVRENFSELRGIYAKEFIISTIVSQDITYSSSQYLYWYR